MAGVFSSQVITVAGRSLIASATATNQIVFVKALSATTVPADPSVTAGYDGVQGTITSSSATNNVARVVTSYNNTNTSTPQPVKAIALMGKLASQSDAEAVIFAYCTDSGSEIYFPGNNAPEQITRFAYNIAFEGDAPLEVTEAGAASLSDLDRFVSLHRAGDPTTGESQVIRGRKTFTNEITLQSTLSSSSLIKTTGAVSGSTGIFGEVYLQTPAGSRNMQATTAQASTTLAFKTVPVAVTSETNVSIATTGVIDVSTTNGINVQSNVSPKQTDTYSLGSSSRRWNTIVAQHIQGETYSDVAQVFAVTDTGIEVKDGDLTPVSGAPIFWSEIRKPYINDTYEFIGRDDKARIGSICLIEITRASAGNGFTIKRGGLVYTWATPAEGGNAKLLVYMQGATANLGEQYRFRLLENAFIYEASGQSSAYTRSKVWAVCVEGEK